MGLSQVTVPGLTATGAAALYLPKGRVSAKAYRSAGALSIANSTTTVLDLDTESWDTHGIHDLVTNPSRFTVPTGYAGFWLAQGQVSFASSGTNARQGRILVNGTLVTKQTVGAAGGGLSTDVAVAGTLLLAEGDYVQLACHQNSGGALNLNGTAVSDTFLTLTYLGST